MAIISVFNQCGGVSKTTLTMNLGYHLSCYGKRVLLVDVDPQASLTVFMGVDTEESERTAYESIMNREPLPIIKGIHGVDLVPSNINLSGAELELVAAEMREVRLKDALASVEDAYDYVLIDCPPSIGLLSYLSLVAATHVLIPIQTQYKALKGTELLLQTIARVRVRANPLIKIAGFIPTLHDSRTGQSEVSLRSINEQLSRLGTVFPPIPRSVAFADAAQSHQPLALYSPKHPAIAPMMQIVHEIIEKVETKLWLLEELELPLQLKQQKLIKSKG